MAVPFNLPSTEEHDSDILRKLKQYWPYLELIIAQYNQLSVNQQTSNATGNGSTATPSSANRVRIAQNCLRELLHPNSTSASSYSQSSASSSSTTSQPSSPSANLHSICDLALLINLEVNATTPDQLTVPPRSPNRRRRLNSECCCDEFTFTDVNTEDWIQLDNDDTTNSPLASLSTANTNGTSNQNNNNNNNNGRNSHGKSSKSNNKTTISDDILSLMDLSLTESLWTATICCVGWHLIWPR